MVPCRGGDLLAADPFHRPEARRGGQETFRGRHRRIATHQGSTTFRNAAFWPQCLWTFPNDKHSFTIFRASIGVVRLLYFCFHTSVVCSVQAQHQPQRSLMQVVPEHAQILTHGNPAESIGEAVVQFPTAKMAREAMEHLGKGTNRLPANKEIGSARTKHVIR